MTLSNNSFDQLFHSYQDSSGNTRYSSWKDKTNFNNLITYSFDQLGSYWGTVQNPSPSLSGLINVPQSPATSLPALLLDQKNVIDELLASSSMASFYRASFSDVTELEFSKLTGTSVGEISIMRADISNQSSLAKTYKPLEQEYNTFAGDMFIDELASSNSALNKGETGYATLLHELGHAVGLDHTHIENLDSNGNLVSITSKTGQNGEVIDNQKYSIMSYLTYGQEYTPGSYTHRDVTGDPESIVFIWR